MVYAWHVKDKDLLWHSALHTLFKWDALVSVTLEVWSVWGCVTDLCSWSVWYHLVSLSGLFCTLLVTWYRNDTKTLILIVLMSIEVHVMVSANRAMSCSNSVSWPWVLKGLGISSLLIPVSMPYCLYVVHSISHFTYHVIWDWEWIQRQILWIWISVIIPP